MHWLATSRSAWMCSQNPTDTTMALSRALALIVIGYAVLVVGMLRWHFSYGPPYYQQTLPLLVVFAVFAALVGLLALWAAMGILHWIQRASGCILAAAIVAGVWLLFFEWNRFLIWQMVVVLAVQMACLVVAIGIFRMAGLTALQDGSIPKRFGKTSQVSIGDLLVLTAAFAFFCGVLRSGRPVELRAAVYGILFAGGCCEALAALTALWVSFSRSNLVLRLVVFAIVAPIGGGLSAIVTHFVPLLYHSGWYAGVTTLQMLLMMAPLVVVRVYGISLGRTSGR